MRRTPKSYVKATWRCTLPVDEGGNQGIGFDLDDGTVVRIYLDRQSLLSLCETLRGDYFSTVSQSDASEGRPKLDVSSTPGTENV